MSNYDRKEGNQTAVDYDRQFQEDLERAQALSLESLALEKFKMQKQQLECSSFVRRAFTSQQDYSTRSHAGDGDCAAQASDR